MNAASTIELALVDGWEQLPEGMRHRDVSDVAVDSRDRVYLLTRDDAQVVVYEPDGSFVGTWGRGVLSERPHGITIGRDDTVYVADEGNHSVRSFTLAGEPLAQIGPAGSPSDTGANPGAPDIYTRIASIARAAGPYNRPTALAPAPNGDLYVTDGYGNAAVHRFDAAGNLLATWGEPGDGPGRFHLPHALVVSGDGRVFVCDRENDRIQVFSLDGEFVDVIDDLHRPAGIDIHAGLLYVSELPWKLGHRTWRHGRVEEPLAGIVRVLDLDGGEVARFGADDQGDGDWLPAPHGIAVDSHGDVYVAQVTWTSGGKAGLFPADAPTFAKLTRSA